MRRDICIGLLASAVFDFGLVLTSTHPALAPLLRSPIPTVVTFILPAIPPEDPPPVDEEENAPKPVDPAVPSIPDVPQMAPIDSITQPLQPPSPSPAADQISIRVPDTDRGSMGPGDHPFEPGNLDQVPVATIRTVPAYPYEQRREGIEGSVLVDFVVDAHGAVQRAYALRSTNPAFEAAAVQGVSKWRFRAGRKSGRPVSTHLQIPIVFSLNHAD
jgi:protein TonB